MKARGGEGFLVCGEVHVGHDVLDALEVGVVLVHRLGQMETVQANPSNYLAELTL